MPRPAPIAALLAVLIAGSGCQVLGDATATIGRDRLIDDMARQLERGQEHSYYADYQLAQGKRGSVAQQAEPKVTVYRFPGGLLQQDAEQLTECVMTRPVRCSRYDEPASDAVVSPGHEQVVQGGIVPVPLAVALVRLAGLQPGALVKHEDATIAGLQATCLAVDLVNPDVTDVPDAEIAAADAFTVCATVDGVLASFTGVVSGVLIDQALIRLANDAPAEAFDLPAEAVPTPH